jgi:CIC family chloride channel protein
MGAAIAKFTADRLRVPEKAQPRLVACGAGAGLAAAFHAPLAGFIFTVEELQREFSPLTYAMALIAAVVADLVAISVWGTSNVFHLTGFPSAPLVSIPIIAAVGVVAGIGGAAFNKSLLRLHGTFQDRFKVPAWQRAGFVGFSVGLVAWWLPEVVGGGHQISEQILRGDFIESVSIGFILLLFAGKFVLTVASYAAGVPGGIFAPMLFMGGCLGLFFGVLTSATAPGLETIPESFAAVGMAAFIAAVVRAPLTGIVLVMEMTGDYQQLLPLILASMIAYIVAEQFKVEPVYDALLSQAIKRGQPRVWADRDPLLFEFVVQEGSEMDGKLIKEIPLPERCLFVTITRQGDDLLPSGDTIIHRGDHITAIVTGAESGEAVRKLLPLSRV